MTDVEREAKHILTIIEHSQPVSYQTLSAFSWLADGITKEELLAISHISDISLRLESYGYPKEQNFLARRRWLADGINEVENLLLGYVYTIRDAARFIAAVDTVGPRDALPVPEGIGVPWAQDELTYDEVRALWALDALIKGHPDLAQIVLDFPWVNDDDISPDEYRVISYILKLSDHPDIAAAVVGFPWLGDGEINTEQANAIQLMAMLVDSSPDRIRTIANATFLDYVGNETMQPRIISAAAYHCWWPGLSQLILDQPWFQDGITAQEGAAIILIGNDLWYGQSHSDYILNELILGEPKAKSETFAISSGDIDIYLLSRSPSQASDDLILDWASTGIEVMADFMGPDWPWPVDDVIVLVEPDYEYSIYYEPGGLNLGSHIMVRGPHKEIVYHELAHFYASEYGSLTEWLVEGWAEFMVSYILQVTEKADLRQRYGLAQERVAQLCDPHQITNIDQWNEATKGLTVSEAKNTKYWPCAYPLGEVFLLEMYDALGHEVVASSLRELYSNMLFGYQPTTENRPRNYSTDKERMIYQVFLSNTPPEMQDEFRDLYRRLHGGPIPDS